MMESGVSVCHTCGEQVGLDENGEVFIACHECKFPICKSCFEYEIKEGKKVCMRCASPYDENFLDDVTTKDPETQATMASHLNNSQPEDVGIHARHFSTVSTVDSEMESGNPIWKNRVESWKDKKNKKNTKATKVENEPAQVPPDQQMEDKPQ